MSSWSTLLQDLNPIDVTLVVSMHALGPMQLPALTPAVVKGLGSSKLQASLADGPLGTQNSKLGCDDWLGIAERDGCDDGWELGSKDG